MTESWVTAFAVLSMVVVAVALLFPQAVKKILQVTTIKLIPLLIVLCMI
jgi:hypothetical protein